MNTKPNKTINSFLVMINNIILIKKRKKCMFINNMILSIYLQFNLLLYVLNTFNKFHSKHNLPVQNK